MNAPDSIFVASAAAVAPATAAAAAAEAGAWRSQKQHRCVSPHAVCPGSLRDDDDDDDV